jgi:predicted  nucleic acid-binding Zn-ribbon protein
MARAHFVKKARKANKAAGIKVGDSYYWWKFRYGGKHYSKTPPRQSQLTNSDKLSRAYAAAEALEDLVVDDDSTLDDLKSQLQDVSSEVEEIAQEYRDNRDNMPESLQDGDVGQQMEENADALEWWASDIEGCLDSLDEDEEDWRDHAVALIEEQAGSCPV